MARGASRFNDSVVCPAGSVTFAPGVGLSRLHSFGSRFLRMLTVVGYAIHSRKPFCVQQWRNDGNSAYHSVGIEEYGPRALPSTTGMRTATFSFAYDSRTRQLARQHYHARAKPPLNLYRNGEHSVALVVGSSQDDSMRTVACVHQMARALLSRSNTSSKRVRVHVWHGHEPHHGAVASAVAEAFGERWALHDRERGDDIHLLHHLVSADILLLTDDHHALSAAALRRGPSAVLNGSLPLLGKGNGLLRASTCLNVDERRAAFECMQQLTAVSCRPISSSTGNDLSTRGWADPWSDGRCPENGLTQELSSDGFGAQFFRLIGAVAASRCKGTRPVCTREWQAMEHGVDGPAMFRFIGGHLYGPPVSLPTRIRIRLPGTHTVHSSLMLLRSTLVPGFVDDFHHKIRVWVMCVQRRRTALCAQPLPPHSQACAQLVPAWGLPRGDSSTAWCRRPHRESGQPARTRRALPRMHAAPVVAILPQPWHRLSHLLRCCACRPAQLLGRSSRARGPRTA
jgi:hypothetical protein